MECGIYMGAMSNINQYIKFNGDSNKNLASIVINSKNRECICIEAIPASNLKSICILS